MEDIQKMDPEAFIALWDLTIDKMVRFHDNISTEVQQLIITIQKTRDGEGNKMVPTAEEKAAFGKVSCILSLHDYHDLYTDFYFGMFPFLLLEN